MQNDINMTTTHKEALTSRDILRKSLKVIIVLCGIVAELCVFALTLFATALSQNTDFSETITATGIMCLVLTIIVVAITVVCYKLVGHFLKHQPATLPAPEESTSQEM